MHATAALADGKGGYFIDQIEVGDPGPGEVLVAIKASGVCHTDFKILHRQPVLIMGHEEAEGVQPGLPWILPARTARV